MEIPVVNYTSAWQPPDVKSKPCKAFNVLQSLPRTSEKAFVSFMFVIEKYLLIFIFFKKYFIKKLINVKY